MTPNPSAKELIETLVWDGVTVEVRYDPDWSSLSKLGADRQIAHIELQVLEPMGAPLPVTETGYRSHFLPPEEVNVAGGPLAYVRRWLGEEERKPAWRRADMARRQLDLFR